MQMQELQIKQADQQRKAIKDQVDAALKAEQIAVEKERVATQAKNDADRNKFDALKTAAQMRDDKEKMFISEAFEALRPEKEKKPKKGD
jgi:regulator of protease activity HflC (stomatin/prohibitin superfamily)